MFLKKPLNWIIRLAANYYLHHILFWLVYVLLVALFYVKNIDFLNEIKVSAALLSFHALVSYVNNYVFVPQLLQKQKVVSYFLSLLLLLVLVTSPMAVLMDRWFSFATNEDYWSLHYFVTNILWIVLTVAVTMSLKLFKNWYQIDRKNVQLRQLNTETELRFLKTQINPHFLFNSLNNLYALTLSKSDNAPEIVLKLSNLLRYILYESSQKKVDLNKEITYLGDYIDLEKLRLGKRAKVEFKVSGDTAGLKIAPMIFIPFLENSFKHGLGSDTKDGVIKVGIFLQQKQLTFIVKNTKPIEAVERKVGGIGLTNVKKRLNLLYHRAYKIDINETDSIYEVKLDLDLNQSPNLNKK